MNWRDIASTVGKHAPLLGTILGGPAGGAVGGLISAALGVEETPDAVDAALRADPGAAAKLVELQERNRHDLEAAHIRAAETSVREVNATMRVEAESGDAYVRRARPTVIYNVNAVVFVMVFGGLLAVTSAPDPSAMAKALALIYAELMLPLTTLCGVVGVYVRSRSTHDKPVAAGKDAPEGLIQTLLARRS